LCWWREAIRSNEGNNVKIRQLALASIAALAGHSHAAQITMDFANNAGLGLGGGTTQTISQNGIQMSVLTGKYEITANPNHELNLKDFAGAVGDTTRTVQFNLLSGLNFDFIGFSFQDGSGDISITSSRGGSTTFNPGSVPAASTFRTTDWNDIAWIRVMTSARFGEAKFNSFTFDNQPTRTSISVPEPSSLALVALGVMAAWRSRRWQPGRC
jgi:PEP-CTERM motif